MLLTYSAHVGSVEQIDHSKAKLSASVESCNLSDVTSVNHRSVLIGAITTKLDGAKQQNETKKSLLTPIYVSHVLNKTTLSAVEEVRKPIKRTSRSHGRLDRSSCYPARPVNNSRKRAGYQIDR
ncbi:hypothetical protein T08_8578 [Trichinella sp. T8]|nr:hypothetical protein T08_8578 [Trichinella sp. T8]